jgi:hypothetical protein
VADQGDGFEFVLGDEELDVFGEYCVVVYGRV